MYIERKVSSAHQCLHIIGRKVKNDFGRIKTKKERIQQKIDTSPNSRFNFEKSLSILFYWSPCTIRE